MLPDSLHQITKRCFFRILVLKDKSVFVVLKNGLPVFCSKKKPPAIPFPWLGLSLHKSAASIESNSMNLIQCWNHSSVSAVCCVFLVSFFNYSKKLECQMLKACQRIFLIDLIQKADKRGAFFSQTTFQWLVHHSIMNRKTHLNIPIWISGTFQANLIKSCAAHTVKK